MKKKKSRFRRLKNKLLSVIISATMALGMTPAAALAAPTASGDGLQDDRQFYDSATSKWVDNEGFIDVNYDTIGGTWTAPDESVHNNGTYIITIPKLIQYLEMQAGIVDVQDDYTVNVKGILPSGKQVTLTAETGKTLSANGTSPITETTTQGKTVWSADDTYGNATVDKILGTDCTDNIKLNGIVNGSAEYTGYVQYTATMEDGLRMLNSTPSYTGTETMTFRSSAPFDTFEKVLMDDVVVDPSNYTATEGSTVITFEDSYIQTLTPGSHTVTIDSGVLGNVSAIFTIVGEVTEPDPGTDPNPGTDPTEPEPAPLEEGKYRVNLHFPAMNLTLTTEANKGESWTKAFYDNEDNYPYIDEWTLEQYLENPDNVQLYWENQDWNEDGTEVIDTYTASSISFNWAYFTLENGCSLDGNAYSDAMCTQPVTPRDLCDEGIYDYYYTFLDSYIWLYEDGSDTLNACAVSATDNVPMSGTFKGIKFDHAYKTLLDQTTGEPDPSIDLSSVSKIVAIGMNDVSSITNDFIYYFEDTGLELVDFSQSPSLCYSLYLNYYNYDDYDAKFHIDTLNISNFIDHTNEPLESASVNINIGGFTIDNLITDNWIVKNNASVSMAFGDWDSVYENVSLKNWVMSGEDASDIIPNFNGRIENLDASGWDITELNKSEGIEALNILNTSATTANFSNWVCNADVPININTNCDTWTIAGWVNANIAPVNNPFVGNPILSDLTFSAPQLRFMNAQMEHINFNNVTITDVAELSFSGCRSLTEIDFDALGIDDCSGIYSYDRMFAWCESLQTINNIDKLGLASTTFGMSMNSMFSGCKSLTELDLSSFNVGYGVSLNNIFEGCENLEVVYVSDGWQPNTNESNCCSMFDGCVKLVDDNYNPYYWDENWPTIYGYMTYKPGPGHTHIYSTENVIAPTCEDDGYTYHACICGNSYTDNEIDALGHNWVIEEVTKEANAVADGSASYRCERCNETKDETIPAGTEPELTADKYRVRLHLPDITLYVDAQLGQSWSEALYAIEDYSSYFIEGSTPSIATTTDGTYRNVAIIELDKSPYTLENGCTIVPFADEDCTESTYLYEYMSDSAIYDYYYDYVPYTAYILDNTGGLHIIDVDTTDPAITSGGTFKGVNVSGLLRYDDIFEWDSNISGYRLSDSFNANYSDSIDSVILDTPKPYSEIKDFVERIGSRDYVDLRKLQVVDGGEVLNTVIQTDPSYAQIRVLDLSGIYRNLPPASGVEGGDSFAIFINGLAVDSILLDNYDLGFRTASINFDSTYRTATWEQGTMMSPINVSMKYWSTGLYENDEVLLDDSIYNIAQSNNYIVDMRQWDLSDAASASYDEIQLTMPDYQSWDGTRNNTSGWILNPDKTYNVHLARTNDLSDWTNAKITDLSFDSMNLSVLRANNFDAQYLSSLSFYGCESLEDVDFSTWNWGTNTIKNASGMFWHCDNMTNIDLSSIPFDESITSASSMFDLSRNVQTIDLSNWDTSRITNMSEMFSRCENLKIIYVNESWSTASVTNSSDMFNECPKLAGAVAYDESNANDASYANYTTGYLTLSTLPADVRRWKANDDAFALTATDDDLNNGTYFAVYSETDSSLNTYCRVDVPEEGSMFNNRIVSAVYTNDDFARGTYNGFINDTQNPWLQNGTQKNNYVTANFVDFMPLYYCCCLFEYTPKLTYVFNIKNLVDSNTRKCSDLFSVCNKLEYVDFDYCDLSGCCYEYESNWHALFMSCNSIKTVDLSKVTFNYTRLTYFKEMFWFCDNLTTILFPNDWNTSNIINMNDSFVHCPSLVLDCSSWDASNVTSHQRFNEGSTHVIPPVW